MKQTSQDTRLAFAEQLDEGSTTGYIQGNVQLPMNATWLLQLYVGGAGYDRNAPSSQAWPTESAGVPDPGDCINMEFNGNVHNWTNTVQNQGKKTVITQLISGNILYYRFDFKSSKTILLLHPLVSNGQITLVRDENAPPVSSAAMGNIIGKCIDGIDGIIIKPGAVVSNGGIAPANTMQIPDAAGEVMLSLFVGSTLFMVIQVHNGQFSASVPAGKYGVIATMDHFYAFYDPNFEVLPGLSNNLIVVLSPTLNPGSSRIVLVWGANPLDLDSYMSISGGDAQNTASCQIWYRQKTCNRCDSFLVLPVFARVHSEYFFQLGRLSGH